MNHKLNGKMFLEIERLLKDFNLSDDLKESLLDGEVLKTQYDKVEYKKFKEDWIVNIESFFPSLDHITRNIKNALRYEEEILPIERTRRTNPESIRHLLRNTRYIKEANEAGDITPDKVLNTLSEIDYGIYENRFIMTLINRLNDYLINRLEVIKKNIHGFKEAKFNMDRTFDIDETNFLVKVDVLAKENFDSKDIDTHNKRLYLRTEEAYKVVSRMYHSDFMRIMSKYKEVKPPILKTQIILRNPDFRNAYMLWLYLDRLHILDYTLETKETSKVFTKKYTDQLDRILSMLFTVVFNNSDFSKTLNASGAVKSIKPESKPLDSYVSNLKIDAFEIDLEPQRATQYYLDKAKQLFTKQFKAIKNEVSDNDQSLKQVLLDQYSIADQIFNYYFEIDQDDDVFDKLTTYKDPIKKYEQALDKYHITKVAREVREKIYLESIVLEDRWIKEAIYLQEEAMKKIMATEEKKNNEAIDDINKKLNKELNQARKKEVLHTKTVLTNQRKKNAERMKALKTKHREMLITFRKQEKERLQKERIKAKEKKALQLKRLKEREKNKRLKEIERLRLTYKSQQERELKRQNEQKKLIKDRNNEKIKKAKES